MLSVNRSFLVDGWPDHAIMALQTGRTVMVKLKDVRVGSIVMVRGNFGTGFAVRAVVAGVEADIKNGRPGIDYTAVGAKTSNWAYLDQVDRVITR